MASLDAERRLAVSLARAGADIAQRFQRGGTRILRLRNKPLGGGPVTAADEAVDDHIVSGLREAFPDDPIVAEESWSQAPWTQGGRVWFVDPIDGTREFARGTPGWTVQLGLCIDGVPVLGVVAEPAHSRVSWACLEDTGGTAWIGETQTPAGAGPLRVSTRPWDAMHIIGGKLSPFSRQRQVHARLGIPRSRVHTVGSVGVRMVSVARGKADCYVQAPGKTKMWDTCPPIALVFAAGGVVSDLRGSPLDFSAPPVTHPCGVVACSRARHETILEALAPLADSWLGA
ncbi:MAG: 3'(2'),5'-bisphosphate nucleotidase CysQ [Nannocystaceae bacterium]|nr:3'(2'),5'-bisphosphate nucleotidase CysQ [bacterium]